MRITLISFPSLSTIVRGVALASTVGVWALLGGACSDASVDPTPATVDGGADAGEQDAATREVPPDPVVEPGELAAECPGGEEAIHAVEHACLHAEGGPFAEVEAVSEGIAPSVSKPHTTYVVSLPNAESRWLSYAPRSTGLHVVYTSPSTRLVVEDAEGVVIPATCEGPTVTAICPALPYQVQLDLATTDAVRVALFPEDEATSTVNLIIESIQ